MKLGVVGLPNVGKSTLFNAITQAGAESANYAFCTIEPNVGVVDVPDERLQVLGKMYATQKIIPAQVEFVDIAGLVKGASKGEGMGNKFLSHIREANAIVHVVRCFEDENIIHVSNKIDPIDDVKTINLELILADLETVSKRLEKAKKQARTNDAAAKEEIIMLEKIRETLEKEEPARKAIQTAEDEILASQFFLLTTKPVIYVANIDENTINHKNEFVERLEEYAKNDGSGVVCLCAKIEDEIMKLDACDQEMFKEELGIKESGLSVLIKKSYDLLGLMSFLTAGEKEVRAWTITKGMKAPQAAGVIHTDFERGFIRAEIVSYGDLVSFGSMQKCKEMGKVRSEGKEYVVQNGDVVIFRFNV